MRHRTSTNRCAPSNPPTAGENCQGENHVPIYEFYCSDCNMLFSFLARRMGSQRMPDCPRCGKTLRKEVSLFAALRAGHEDTGDDDDAGFDEERMAGVMERMAGEIEQVDENDPRQAAQAMRKLAEAGGMRLSDSMTEALARMEAGEDPDALESELGDALETENPFQAPDPPLCRLRSLLRPPRRDPHLYDL